MSTEIVTTMTKIEVASSKAQAPKATMALEMSEIEGLTSTTLPMLSFNDSSDGGHPATLASIRRATPQNLLH
jgi:hypothetical protein